MKANPLTTLFHRELSTSIQFLKRELHDVDDTEDISCGLLFTEVIPSGAYVDPYQIASLKSFGGPDVSLYTKQYMYFAIV